MDLLRTKTSSYLLQRLHYSQTWYFWAGKMIWNEVLEEGKGRLGRFGRSVKKPKDFSELEDIRICGAVSYIDRTV